MCGFGERLLPSSEVFEARCGQKYVDTYSIFYPHVTVEYVNPKPWVLIYCYNSLQCSGKAFHQTFWNNVLLPILPQQHQRVQVLMLYWLIVDIQFQFKCVAWG